MCHLGRGDHRLELWKIKALVWEECPTFASNFDLGIRFLVAPYISWERK